MHIFLHLFEFGNCIFCWICEPLGVFVVVTCSPNLNLCLKRYSINVFRIHQTLIRNTVGHNSTFDIANTYMCVFYDLMPTNHWNVLTAWSDLHARVSEWYMAKSNLLCRFSSTRLRNGAIECNVYMCAYNRYASIHRSQTVFPEQFCWRHSYTPSSSELVFCGRSYLQHTWCEQPLTSPIC